MKYIHLVKYEIMWCMYVSYISTGSTLEPLLFCVFVSLVCPALHRSAQLLSLPSQPAPSAHGLKVILSWEMLYDMEI